MGIASELTTIKEDISDGVVANKVSRFAYTEQAYTDNDVDGVSVYNVNQEQNIPVGTAGVMKVNQTVIEKGWRARASSITRMLMNHFLGRISYNLNKANDMINSILDNLVTYLGIADGIATLDSDALVPSAQLPKSNVAENTDTKMFTAKGAFDYTLGSSTARSWFGKVFGHLFGRMWGEAEGLYSVTPMKFKYANGLWVCGCSIGGCWWSEDGKNWTQGTTTSVDTMSGVISLDYANGLWVCVDQQYGCWWSEDGKAWTRGTGNIDSTAGKYVKYANGLWVCGSDTGFWWSEDGKAWTQGTGGTSRDVHVLYYANNLWVGGTDEGCWWSANGKAWVQGTGGTSIDVRDIKQIKRPYAGYIWVCGSDTGCWWSEDGKAWTQGTGIAVGVYCVQYANGLWVCGSDTGCWWSEDGKAWTQGTGGNTSSKIVDIGFANGLWLCGADSNGCWLSEDGKAWTQSLEVNFSGGTVRAFSYSDGLWLCGLNHGGYWSGIEQLIEQGYFVD